MTTGQMLFVSGSVLLVFTIILGVIFWIKKPQYRPENVVYCGGDTRHTQKLRNGYPTDPLTIHREPQMAVTPGIVIPQDGTERLTESQTDVLPETAALQRTELLDDHRTEKLEDEAAPLTEETTPLHPFDKTVLLSNSAESSDEGTMVLGQNRTEKSVKNYEV